MRIITLKVASVFSNNLVNSYKVITIFFLLGITCISCNPTLEATNYSKLLKSYEDRIGCQHYASLRPAVGDFDELKLKCKAHYTTVDPHKELVSAHVYKTMNKGLLFVHLAFKSEKNIWDAVNYLFDTLNNKIVGYYKCY